MAASDYRACDMCHGKTFYDATLDYQEPDAAHQGRWWLHGVGDWAVLCEQCAKTHVVTVMARQFPLD